MSLKKWFLFGALVGAAGLLFIVGKGPQSNLVTTESLSSSPDYFITQVRVKEFDPSGKLIETLEAAKTLHYLAAKKTLLEFPFVERHADTSSWSAESLQGVIEDGSKDILLTQDAKALKRQVGAADITLSADTVHYLDKDQSLSSYGNAKLYSTQGITSASKITAFINSGEVIMTKPVRGHYEPTR
ncbi:LPS export ABC transporter periplasmic protein LptC [Marinomonas epiphytica]